MRTIPDPSSMAWVKSSYSNNNGGGCVEWAPAVATTTGAVPVRDSKDPHGPALTFATPAWTAFLRTITGA
ncbi:DUF397 domain-containing protein [Streptomyces sp. 4N509B]|uniref:DUF397 domain-containing protein n=1 Tax=Streptomyces sp. 4N509B TaxID=3457413 RepID=UPI003FD3B6CB